MIEQWMPPIWNRFTRGDFDFLTTVLAPEDGQQRHLQKLCHDPEALREILDLKEVFRGVLEDPSALCVSPRFYFYVLVRHAFLQAGLLDADLADYVSRVMGKRVGCCAEDPLQDVAWGFTRAADFVAILASSKGRMRFHLQLAAGNQFLILTGLYPKFLERQCDLQQGASLEFYEAFACKAFREAADNRRAPGKAARLLLGNLADAMPTARRSLNRLAEEFVFLGD
jgi:hypothetical protein